MKPHLLLIEPEAEIREVLVEMLQDEGLAAAVPDSEQAADEALAEGRFDMVLADAWSSKRAAAWEELVALRARAAPTPVGLLSSWNFTNAEAEQAGFAFLLPKPFSAEDLLVEVARCLPSPALEAPCQQLIGEYFASLQASDWDRLGALCTDDVVYHLPGGDQRFSRTVRGRSKFQQFARTTFEDFPEVRFEVESAHWLPSGAVARYRGSWRGHERREQMEGAVRFSLQRDRIARIGVRLELRALTAKT